MLLFCDNVCLINKEKERLLFESESNSIISPKNNEVFNSCVSYIKNKTKQIKNTELENEIRLLFRKKKIRDFDTYDYLSESPSSSKLTLMLTQDCNLSCKYCYGGESGRYGTTGEKMPDEIAYKAIENLVSNNPLSKKFQITLFGGEPLLHFSLIKKIFIFCDNLTEKKGISFSYTMTTNGTLLNKEIILSLKKRKVSLLISIDGIESIHDKNRIFKDGSGSFQIIQKNLKILNEYKKSFAIRSTIENDDFINLSKNISFFKELGASQVHISNLNQYSDDDETFPVNIPELSIINKSFHKVIHKIKSELLRGKKPFYVPFLTALNKIHLTNKSLVSCGFMKGTTAVSSDGKYFPCHRFVGVDGFDYGTVKEGIDQAKQKAICNSLDNATKLCSSCFAKYICARSCVRDIAKTGGKFISFPESYCNILKENIAEYLLIYKQIKDKQPDFFKSPMASD